MVMPGAGLSPAWMPAPSPHGWVHGVSRTGHGRSGAPRTKRATASAEHGSALRDDGDDAAGDALAGVAGRLAAVVVRIGVHDDRATGHVVGGTGAQGQARHVHVDAGDAI